MSNATLLRTRGDWQDLPAAARKRCEKQRQQMSDR